MTAGFDDEGLAVHGDPLEAASFLAEVNGLLDIAKLNAESVEELTSGPGEVSLTEVVGDVSAWVRGEVLENCEVEVLREVLYGALTEGRNFGVHLVSSGINEGSYLQFTEVGHFQVSDHLLSVASAVHVDVVSHVHVGSELRGLIVPLEEGAWHVEALRPLNLRPVSCNLSVEGALLLVSMEERVNA